MNDVHSLMIGSVINNGLLIFSSKPKIPYTNVADGIASYGGRHSPTHDMYVARCERVSYRLEIKSIYSI